MIGTTVAAALVLATTTAFALSVPQRTGRVTDTAGILSAEARQKVTERIEAHAQATGNQIVVLTVPSLEGENIDEYAVRVFEDWKPGRKGKDNGVLLVVALQDRRVRIEVGYGLEGTLPDSACGSIIRSAMKPRFKQGDYSGGISDGVAAIISTLETGEQPVEEAAADEAADAARLSSEERLFTTMAGIIISIPAFLILLSFSNLAICSRGKTGWIIYAVLSCVMFTGILNIFNLAVAIIATFIYLIAFPIVKLQYGDYLRRKTAERKRMTSGSGSDSSDYSWGSDSSSDSSSSDSDSGGSSGGGGASDSW